MSVRKIVLTVILAFAASVSFAANPSFTQFNTNDFIVNGTTSIAGLWSTNAADGTITNKGNGVTLWAKNKSVAIKTIDGITQFAVSQTGGGAHAPQGLEANGVTVTNNGVVVNLGDIVDVAGIYYGNGAGLTNLGAALTPWTTDINGGNHSLTNVNAVAMNGALTALSVQASGNIGTTTGQFNGNGAGMTNVLPANISTNGGVHGQFLAISNGTPVWSNLPPAAVAALPTFSSSQFWSDGTQTNILGAGLTNLNAANLVGGPVTNAVNTSGSVTANSFTGNASTLTNYPLSAITNTGVVLGSIAGPHLTTNGLRVEASYNAAALTNLTGNGVALTNIWIRTPYSGDRNNFAFTAATAVFASWNSVNTALAAQSGAQLLPTGGYLSNLIVFTQNPMAATTNFVFVLQTNLPGVNAVNTPLTATLLGSTANTVWTNSGTTSVQLSTNPTIGVMSLTASATLASQTVGWSVEWWHQSP